MPPGPHDAHEAKPRSWMAMPHRVRTIARPPTVGSPRPPLLRLLRSARRRLRDRPACLGSTTSPGRLASTSSTPTSPDLQSDSPPPTAPLHTTHTKPNRDLGWQCPIASGLSHGRPQWVRRVRRFCASSASHVAAFAIGLPA